MVLFFTVKEKVLLGDVFAGEHDPLGGAEGVEMAVMQRYICLFGIPYGGTRKMVKAFSVGTGEMIPVLLWSESMKKKADDMLPLARGAWKKRIVGQAILVALAAFILWLVLLGYQNVNYEDRHAENVENPAVGDIILASVTISRYTDQNTPSALKVLRIEEIRGDSLIVVRSHQSEDTMEQYRIKNKDKLIGLFDISDNAFANTREVYSLSKYREGDQYLRRIVREGLTGAEWEEQDSLFKYTDTIKPLYVKRIKK